MMKQRQNIRVSFKVMLSLVFFVLVTACINPRPTQKEMLLQVKKNELSYKGKDLSELLKKLPGMKTLSVFKDFPQRGTTSLSITFLKDKEYHDQVNKNKKPSNVIVYTQPNPDKPVEISDQTASEDLNMKEALLKYGNLKIVAVHVVNP